MPGSPSPLRFSRSTPIKAPISSAVAKSRITARSNCSIMTCHYTRRETAKKAAIRARAAGLGLAPVRFTAATLPPEVGESLPRRRSTAGDHGTMDWLAREPRAARPRPTGCGRRHAPRSSAASTTGRTRDPLPELAPARSRLPLGLCPPSRLSRRAQGPAEGAGGLDRGPVRGCEVKVFVDTAPVLEKPLAQQAGLGWQGKHTNLVSRDARLLAVPGRDPDRPRPAARRARARPLRQLPPLPRHLPDRRLPDALPARCAALHQLPDDRAQGPDPARAAAADGQPDLRLRRLPRRLPVEQVRAGHPRDEAAGARRSGGTLAGRARRAGRCRLPAALRRQPGQADRPRPVRAQRADRDRQQRRAGAAGRWRSDCWATARRWCGVRRSGRWRGLPRPTRMRQLRAEHGEGELDEEVREEWAAA